MPIVDLKSASLYSQLRARLIRYEQALQEIATGSSGRGDKTDLAVCRSIAAEALKQTS